MTNIKPTTRPRHIKVEDYIKSDFFSPIQGFIIGEAILGKDIPCWQVKLPNGTVEYIIKGQELLYLTCEKHGQLCSRYETIKERERGEFDGYNWE